MDFLEWAKDVVATDLLTDKITYHEIFYTCIANTAKLEHEKKCFLSMKWPTICHKVKNSVAMFTNMKRIQRILNNLINSRGLW